MLPLIGLLMPLGIAAVILKVALLALSKAQVAVSAKSEPHVPSRTSFGGTSPARQQNQPAKGAGNPDRREARSAPHARR